MEIQKTLLLVCAEFEAIASAPKHAHVRLVMNDLFDVIAIKKLYDSGALTEDASISMLERRCKWAREELKIAAGKVKKKTKSVITTMPSEFDGMAQKGGPVGDIAKLNQYSDKFVKIAKLDDMLLKRIDNTSGLAKEVLEYALAYKKSPEDAQKQYGTEMLHLVALRILEDLDLIKSDVKGAISANNKATRVRPDMDPLGNPMDMGYPTDWAK